MASAEARMPRDGGQNTPKISFIVPVYNMGALVHRSVSSILNQDYSDTEILLVNDGSTDASPEVCDQIALSDERVRVIHKSNGGLSSARNAGVRAARGDYVGFLDADDWIAEHSLTHIAAAIRENEADCVRATHWKTDGQVDRVHRLSVPSGLRSTPMELYELALAFMYAREPSYTPLFFIKREIALSLPFDESVPFLEDSLYASQLMRRVETADILDFPFYYYFENGTGMSKNPANFARNVLSVARVGDLMARELSEYPAYIASDDQRVRSQRADLLGRQLVSAVSLRVIEQEDFLALAARLAEDEHFVRLVSARHPAVSRRMTDPLLSRILNGKTKSAWVVAKVLGNVLRLRDITKAALKA